MTKTYIHVNQHVVKANLKHGENKPAITVKTGRQNTYCHKATVLGDCQVVQSETLKPLLSCGARIVIVTSSPVKTETYEEVLE